MTLSLASHDRDSLAAWLRARGESPTHAARILRHHYEAHGAPDWSAVPLSRTLRRALEEHCAAPVTRVLRRVESADGTVKLLLGLARGGSVESVLMPSYRPGEAWCCVSSQVGCAMGCDFCASTRGGLERNLELDELIEQFLHLGAEAARQGRRLRRLVFMGMGEPMHNLDAVLAAIDRMAEPGLGGLGWRRVTISTVGIVAGIQRLAQHPRAINLAVSLHAPDDETRARIVPTTRRYKVVDIVGAARAFFETTGRIVNFEYCLLAGVNDSDAQAERLADVLDGFRAHVNLIPYNPTGPGLSGTVYQPPSPEQVARFVGLLRARGVVAHTRDTRGDDVRAACGQLRETSAHGGR